MLMLNSWGGDHSNNGEWSDGPMNGEGCDLSVPSPALAGYLGNAENRGVVSGACPWCSSKGQINILRSYAFNFKESITLCTSPLCLFPLVSVPLDNVCAILSSSQDVHGCKRKFSLTDSKNLSPSSKSWKKEDPDIVSDEKCWNVGECTVYAKSISKGLFINDCKKQQESADQSNEAILFSGGDSEFGAQINGSVSSSRDKTLVVPPMDVTVQDLIQMVPTVPCLFWQNKDNLCWLDSLLVALVHSRILKETCQNACLSDKFPCKNNHVKNLCTIYWKSCSNIKAKEQCQADNIVRVPSDDLQKVEQLLDALRMSTFQLLQPTIQCELGEKEMAVFALPLLLRSDDWVNSHFQHTGQWDFQCSCCGYSFSSSMETTVTTFTQIMADWHPLNAVHRTQCNNCHNKNQKRKLVLKRISSVLAMHFVEGLPQRDISKYVFDFNGMHYNIRTIIQYNEQREHFVTWVHQPDELWLEFDDLKYPHCITHRRFTVPANQFYLIFWEAGSRKISDLPDPLPENIPTQKINNMVEDFEYIANPIPDDLCIIEALTENKDYEAVVAGDSSIGSKTLLDTFEGLSHSDIVTLALVNVDAEENALKNVQETVTVPAESSVTEAFHLQEEHSLETPYSVINRKDGAKKVSPSMVKVSNNPPKVLECPPAPHSSNLSTSNLSLLFHQHPSHQSIPLRVPLHATHLKIDPRSDCNEAPLAKPAELFGGYRSKNSPNTVLPGGHVRNSFVKLPIVPQKLFSCSGNTTPVGQVSMLMKSDSQNIPNSSPSKVFSTEALRLKLMKKLKAKKKKLAKLNQLLSIDSESTPRPDSTDISSPYSVSSSTSAYDSPAFDNFFAELLSPAMSASNLSPDSTGLLDILTNSNSVETSESSPQDNCAPASKHPVPLLNDKILDELMSGSREQQSVIENAEINALDLFF